MQGIQDLWEIVKDVWQEGYAGIDFSSLIIALGIIALALMVRGIFTRFAINRIIAYAQRSDSKVDDELVLALKGPIRFIPVVIGVYFALEVPEFGDDPEFSAAAGKIVRSLIVFNIFWALYCSVNPLTFLLGKLEELFSAEMVGFLVKIMKGIIVGLGAATILQLWGIQVGPIIAGFGIVGVAVALGAQDLFKNLISGFLILAEKRFKAGDWVLVDGVVEGTVENIGFRSTTIRRFDKAITIVPNATFADRAVTNFTEMTHRRIYWKIGVEYSTTVAQLQQITDKIRAYLLGNKDFAQPDEALMFVVTDSFNNSSIDIMIYCFTKTTKWGEWLDIKQDFAYAIKAIVEQAGTGFAFPSMSIYRGIGAAEPDPFIPPEGYKDGYALSNGGDGYGNA
ncbi:mechanosensitive ion channel [Sneathiella chungangensis]|uniref:Mechanosensitive ion channel n=1 Tax=Sneathiella chungangensis TaxID=1418234 RepID=A0A845MFN7_9PROT|nr:mechanosensitive ion channel [Sneathiella chungangensis]